jgi:hypothetical protein
MAITPDTKDWTWVLERRCPECGFDARASALSDLAGLVRANADDWRAVLRGDALTRRPDKATWSPLEYACHVRDVFRIYRWRIDKMLSEPDPLFPNWDQDASALEERYNDQAPAAVAEELTEAASALADQLDGVTAAQWDRPGRRSDGNAFTVATVARYMVHDPIHHLWDVMGRPPNPWR